jgi:hypothetical protein
MGRDRGQNAPFYFMLDAAVFANEDNKRPARGDFPFR